MGENAAIFKHFDGFSRANARAEFRLRFSNLLSGRSGGETRSARGTVAKSLKEIENG